MWEKERWIDGGKYPRTLPSFTYKDGVFYLAFIKGDIRSNDRINNFKASKNKDSKEQDSEEL